MASRKYEGLKYEGIESSRTLDSLSVEEALQIDINDQPFTVSMRTPGKDREMVRGLLHAEGVINDVHFDPEMLLKKENDNGVVSIINVKIPKEKLGEGYSNSRSLLSVSSCGICGKTELSDLSFLGKHIDSQERIEVNVIADLFRSMKSQQFDFSKTGGCHAAAAFSIEGALLSSAEDIGRHNAVDKVVGDLINQKKLKQARVLTVSGRISYEIVIKCFKARIPLIAAVSAPSSLAVDYAKELGITLMAFSRGDRTTCYSHPSRITHKSNTKAS